MTEKQKRGFALLSPERLREIAQRGGLAPATNPRHRFTPEAAKAAGAKGGATTAARRKERDAEKTREFLNNAFDAKQEEANADEPEAEEVLYT